MKEGLRLYENFLQQSYCSYRDDTSVSHVLEMLTFSELRLYVVSMIPVIAISDRVVQRAAAAAAAAAGAGRV